MRWRETFTRNNADLFSIEPVGTHLTEYAQIAANNVNVLENSVYILSAICPLSQNNLQNNFLLKSNRATTLNQT